MKTDSGREHAFYLPDFRTSRATLAIVLIVELTAFVLTLARQSLAVDFWTDLVRTSMFLLWIGLAGAALLCAPRGPLARSPVAGGLAGGVGPHTPRGGPGVGGAGPVRSTPPGQRTRGRGLFPPTPGQVA